MFWKIFKLAPWSFVIYPPLALLSWLVTFITWFPMCFIIATISMITGSNQVPWLGWFYTHDASLDGGIEQNKEGYDPNATGFKLWWQRVSWICRNPGYRFNAYVIGFTADGTVLIFESGVAYPPARYWTVLETDHGWRFFGYRNGPRWLGWKYTPIAGRHQLKSKPL